MARSNGAIPEASVDIVAPPLRRNPLKMTVRFERGDDGAIWFVATFPPRDPLLLQEDNHDVVRHIARMDEIAAWPMEWAAFQGRKER